MAPTLKGGLFTPIAKVSRKPRISVYSQESLKPGPCHLISPQHLPALIQPDSLQLTASARGNIWGWRWDITFILSYNLLFLTTHAQLQPVNMAQIGGGALENTSPGCHIKSAFSKILGMLWSQQMQTCKTNTWKMFRFFPFMKKNPKTEVVDSFMIN